MILESDGLLLKEANVKSISSLVSVHDNIHEPNAYVCLSSFHTSYWIYPSCKGLTISGSKFFMCNLEILEVMWFGCTLIYIITLNLHIISHFLIHDWYTVGMI